MQERNSSTGGDCFIVHGRMMLNNECSDRLLVHGIVTGQGAIAGKEYEHCWLEDARYCYDYSNNRKITLPKEVYYAIGNIKDCEGRLHRYNKAKALYMMRKYGHFGDWELNDS